MNWLDMFVLVAAIALGVTGLLMGAVKLVLPLVGTAVGVVAAMRYYQPLASNVLSSESSLARFAAFAIILVAALVASAIIASLISKALSLIMLGWLNRLAGGAIGLVLGTLVSLVLILLASHYIDLEPTLKDSALASRLLDYFPFVLRLVPENFRKVADFLIR
ncbi:MAG: CvpA family protein [Chloroflexi bacterium]|nr:CvpA family protein [Chloroflexota bacterium]